MSTHRDLTNRKVRNLVKKLPFLRILNSQTEINHLKSTKFYEISVGGFREKCCYTVRVIFEVL